MSGFRRRVIALACREWGSSPAEIERQIRAREVLLPDFIELIKSRAYDPWQAAGTFAYLFPNLKAKEDRAKEQRAARSRRMNIIIQQLGNIKGLPASEEKTRRTDELVSEYNALKAA